MSNRQDTMRARFNERGGAGGVVPQRKVEQCGGVAMPLSTGDPHQPHHGTRPEDNSDICTL